LFVRKRKRHLFSDEVASNAKAALFLSIIHPSIHSGAMRGGWITLLAVPHAVFYIRTHASRRCV